MNALQIVCFQKISVRNRLHYRLNKQTLKPNTALIKSCELQTTQKDENFALGISFISRALSCQFIPFCNSSSTKFAQHRAARWIPDSRRISSSVPHSFLARKPSFWKDIRFQSFAVILPVRKEDGGWQQHHKQRYDKRRSYIYGGDRRRRQGAASRKQKGGANTKEVYNREKMSCLRMRRCELFQPVCTQQLEAFTSSPQYQN